MREFSWLHNFESREDIHEFRNLGCSHETFDFSFRDSPEELQCKDTFEADFKSHEKDGLPKLNKNPVKSA